MIELYIVPTIMLPKWGYLLIQILPFLCFTFFLVQINKMIGYMKEEKEKYGGGW